MDYKHRTQDVPVGRKVAVIGAGTSGLDCAETLVQKGHQVTIFESMFASDGLLVDGIQNSKSARDGWQEKREEFECAGVKFILHTDIGKGKTVDGLFEEGFDAVFIDIGPEMDKKMEDTPGADLPGVYQATDFLAPGYGLPLEIGRRVVVVIGDGDMASDCLRAALRLGFEDVREQERINYPNVCAGWLTKVIFLAKSHKQP